MPYGKRLPVASTAKALHEVALLDVLDTRLCPSTSSMCWKRASCDGWEFSTVEPETDRGVRNSRASSEVDWEEEKEEPERRDKTPRVSRLRRLMLIRSVSTPDCEAAEEEGEGEGGDRSVCLDSEFGMLNRRGASLVYTKYGYTTAVA